MKKINIDTKIEIIQFVEISAKNIGVKTISKKFNIEKTEVCDILKYKVYLLQIFVE